MNKVDQMWYLLHICYDFTVVVNPFFSAVSAFVPRILNEKEAFISGRFLGLCSSSLFIFDEHFL